MIFVYTCTICVDSWNQLKTKFKVFFEPFLFRYEGVDISFHKPKWGYNQLIYGRGYSPRSLRMDQELSYQIWIE